MGVGVMEYRCKAWWRWVNDQPKLQSVTDEKINLICRIEKVTIWVQNILVVQYYCSVIFLEEAICFFFSSRINPNSAQFTWLSRDKSLTWSVSKSWLCYVITSHHRIHSTKHFLWHTDRTRMLAVTQKQSPVLSLSVSSWTDQEIMESVCCIARGK